MLTTMWWSRAKPRMMLASVSTVSDSKTTTIKLYMCQFAIFLDNSDH